MFDILPKFGYFVVFVYPVTYIVLRVLFDQIDRCT